MVPSKNNDFPSWLCPLFAALSPIPVGCFFPLLHSHLCSGHSLAVLCAGSWYFGLRVELHKYTIVDHTGPDAQLTQFAQRWLIPADESTWCQTATQRLITSVFYPENGQNFFPLWHCVLICQPVWLLFSFQVGLCFNQRDQLLQDFIRHLHLPICYVYPSCLPTALSHQLFDSHKIQT